MLTNSDPLQRTNRLGPPSTKRHRRRRLTVRALGCSRSLNKVIYPPAGLTMVVASDGDQRHLGRWFQDPQSRSSKRTSCPSISEALGRRSSNWMRSPSLRTLSPPIRASNATEYTECSLAESDGTRESETG